MSQCYSRYDGPHHVLDWTELPLTVPLPVKARALRMIRQPSLPQALRTNDCKQGGEKAGQQVENCRELE